jgi:hypothetical protein
MCWFRCHAKTFFPLDFVAPRRREKTTIREGEDAQSPAREARALSHRCGSVSPTPAVIAHKAGVSNPGYNNALVSSQSRITGD